MRWFLALVLGGGLLGLVIGFDADEPAGRTASPRFPSELEIARPPAPTPPPPAQPRERERLPWPQRRYAELQESMRRAEPSTVRALARATTLYDSLYRLDGLPREVLPGEQRDRFSRALELARHPLARQYAIFLAALTVPYDVVEPWLQDLRRDGTPGDREDALCALAFSGDADALATFGALAPETATALAPWPLTEGHAAGLARRLMRSYRCIEVLDREPYYKNVYVHVRVPFLPHPRPDDATARALRRAWLQRYAGHPGSDDAALRIALSHQQEGDHFEAARWFSRAAVLPDRDKLARAARMLVSTCELLLTPEQIYILAHDKGLDSPNRALLQYVRLRRVAAGRGCERALSVAAGLASAEPDSVLAHAWRNRWAAPVPRGIDSGLEPLPASDPLRWRGPQRARPPLESALRSRSGLEYRWTGTEEEKRDPWPEALVIRPDVVARQFRVWETLADLERRTRIATRTARGDLLYKRAAVLYHNRGAYFPAYGQHSTNFAWVVYDALDDAAGLEDAARRFEAESFAWLRAVAMFDRLEREVPDYAGIDRVLFSKGLALKRLVDYRPYHRFYWRRERFHPLVRDLVAAFERCADEHPQSPLAPDARRAANYWRANSPKSWE